MSWSPFQTDNAFARMQLSGQCDNENELMNSGRPLSTCSPGELEAMAGSEGDSDGQRRLARWQQSLSTSKCGRGDNVPSNPFPKLDELGYGLGSVLRPMVFPPDEIHNLKRVREPVDIHKVGFRRLGDYADPLQRLKVAEHATDTFLLDSLAFKKRC